MKRSILRDRRGVTLIELVVGLVIMGFLVSAVLSFVRQQEMAFGFGSGKMSALQNYRFAADLLERNLRTAGTGIAPGQPFVVYADSATIAFNADYATNDTADVFAVYQDFAAPDAEVGSLTRPRRYMLPQSSFTYPDSTYRDGGAASSAETIIFYFAPDASTTRSDDYVLYRRVNDRPAEVVARSLLRDGTQPFFRYQEVVVTDTAAPTAAWVDPIRLPLRHSAPMHMSPADTGAVARIDRIRAVQVSLRATDGKTGATSQNAPLRRLIRMPNAGQAQLRTCGEPPQFGSAISAAQVANEHVLEVSWNQSVDEASGEQDVIRYAIYRRLGGSGPWNEPVFSLPAGNPSYIFADAAVEVGETYQYAVAAQDCTPSMSPFRSSSAVTVAPVTVTP
jgi:prepilin-type N-terminal cleavage/methylation domain-containing protein